MWRGVSHDQVKSSEAEEVCVYVSVPVLAWAFVTYVYIELYKDYFIRIFSLEHTSHRIVFDIALNIFSEFLPLDFPLSQVCMYGKIFYGFQ